MAHILKNQHLEIRIDFPHENYDQARFDQTGKIAAVTYRGRSVTGTELAENQLATHYGQGLYNEFGINTPFGYPETEVGDWFHKIGVGLLRKEEEQYDFKKAYTVRPATFEVATGADQLSIRCRSRSHNGYAYILKKEIELSASGFTIRYRLNNVGEKAFTTHEYNHNFLAIAGDRIGSVYRLKFPFSLHPASFGERVDPEELVAIGTREITFRGHPREQFFFSNLTGGNSAPAQWALENDKHRIGIAETGDFRTSAVNLWGWGHVISPELFIEMQIPAGSAREWTRTYTVYELD